jgi:hypothetical protein
MPDLATLTGENVIKTFFTLLLKPIRVFIFNNNFKPGANPLRKILAGIVACLLDLKFKQSKLTRLIF